MLLKRLIKAKMSGFNVKHWLSTNTASAGEVSVSQPVQVSCWTKTCADQGNTIHIGDTSGLPTYHHPQLPADLNEGFPDKYTAKDESTTSPVDPIIQAASEAGVDWNTVNVCSFRNNLNKILLTPLNQQDGWEVDCCFWSRTGTLFLDIVKGPPPSWPGWEKFTYYGYKFEALCTGEDHVDATSEFSIVVRYRLGEHQMIMGAEVDAELPGGPEGPLGGRPYVELKTYKVPLHARAVADMYGSKHPRWWVQSFLAGIPTLVLGGRDQRGTLIKVQEVPVQLLPGSSANANQHWSPQLLLSFGDAVLTWLTNVAKQYPDQQLRCSYDPSSSSITCEVDPEGDMPGRLSELL